MKVLYLGPDSALIPFLAQCGEDVTRREDALDAAELGGQRFDFLISYGYRHILRRPVLDLFPGRAINLHISFLPWNRGADPNFWSHVDDSPKGVTIHYLDEGVDTGDIIAERALSFPPGATLSSSYADLKSTIEELFRAEWPRIKSGQCSRIKQTPGGSVHRVRDRPYPLDFSVPITTLKKPLHS